MTIPPIPRGLPDDRATRTANRLHSLAIHLLRQVAQVDREMGLTPERASVLSVLAFGGPKTIGQLARAERVSPPAITRIVDGLETAGLAERRRSDEDRRVVFVSVTADGRRLMERGRARRVETLAAGLRALEPGDVRSLEAATDVLERVVDG
ncbi:MAG TPA: MarR family transcriptional regulator [Actinomycetota bacterium]|nr:MarR family transcriptional regulator [Actinomycetota bacterium]